jgi:twitching motility protein PilT
LSNHGATPDYRAAFLKLLQRAVQADASDLHLKTGCVPYFRVDGAIQPQEGDILARETMEGFARFVMSDDQFKHLMKRGEVDLSFHEKGLGRFRINAFRQRGTLSMVMRRIKSKIPSFEQLDLPQRCAALCRAESRPLPYHRHHRQRQVHHAGQHH